MTNMKRQLRRLGLGFDNRRTFATIDDDYYRWTQWIFLQIWDALVRRRGRARGRWPRQGPPDQRARRGVRVRPSCRRSTPRVAAGPTCPRPSAPRSSRATAWPTRPRRRSTGAPGLGTVLSNEEVTNEGRSERGNYPVFRATSASGRCASRRMPTAWPTTSTASTGPRRSSSCSATGSAGPRVRASPSPSPPARASRTASTSSPRAPTRSSARPSWSSRPSTRSSTRWCRKATGPRGPRTPGRGRTPTRARPRRRPWRHTSSRRHARVTSSARPRARTRPASSPARGPRIP